MRVALDALLRALADGELHSGAELALHFGVTRAAISKAMRKLAHWGLDVSAVPGVGYRLARPIDLIDASALRCALAQRTARRLARLEVFTELDSTNGRLLASDAPPPGELAVCLAEYQTAGRGRRGRRWLAPLGGGLCISAGWQFAGAPRDLAALTLAVGVVARRALAEVAGLDVALKWPNDLALDERKLGGILIEVAAEAQGRCYAVVGIGINVALPPESLAKLSDWPRGAIDLATALRGVPPPRALVAARLLDGLADLFASYAETGFAPYRAEWRAADYLLGRRVKLDDAAVLASGTARGIDGDGALLIETANGARRRVISGDVSVRSA
jgi:BirA family transcriptional regulator, biotin operon repressor / biotin---[acetyl-CoA-carboxylase] ligase